jgi:deazaflavin-dependent oxidoreductase (nitroreductase family)
MRAMLRVGLPMGPTVLLKVRGRKTGKTHTTPVGLFERGDRRWLFAEFGQVNWVRNLRENPAEVIGRGRHHESITAVELSTQDAAAVLHDIVVPWLKGPMGTMAAVMAGGPIFGVSMDAPVAAFVGEVNRHPIFEVTSPER